MKNDDCCFTRDNKWFRYRTAALIIENNCILFAGNKNCDYYYTIGGGVHLLEKAEDCVKREVFEETGINYEIDHLAVICENFFDGKSIGLDADCHCLEFYFLMKSKGNQELNSNSFTYNNVKEFMTWIPIDKINSFNIKPSFLKKRINEIIESKNILHIVTDVDK